MEASLVFGIQDDAAASKAAELPPRPALPATLACALSLWAACALSFHLARGLEAAACIGGGVAGLACAVAAFFMLWRTRRTFIAAAILGAALGLACGMGVAADQHLDEQQVVGQSGAWSFEALEDASEGAYGYTCLVRAKVAGVGTVKVVVQFDGDDVEPLRMGDVFEASGTFVAVSETSAAYRWRQGAVARITLYSVEPVERTDLFGLIAGVRNAAIDLIGGFGDGEGAAILAALVCGWREDLDDLEIYEDFKTCGLAHLVAVSGAHLSIVTAFVSSALGLLRAPRALSAAVQVGFVLIYLVLAGVPISAVRAAAMSLASLFSFTARRRPASVAALSLCIIVCIVVDPTTALSVSFALSALSTLGIILFAGFFGAWIGHAAPVLPRGLRDATSLTFASSLMATPLSAALFSQVPLLAPLANAVTAPIFPLACAGGLVLVVASLVLPAASGALLGVATGATGLLAGVVSLLAQIPYASIAASLPVAGAIVASVLVAAALWIFWPRPRKAVVAGLVAAGGLAFACLLFAVPLLAGTEIVMLDVDQGDAFLVRSQGVTVLIDTGTEDALLKAALARHGVTHIDAVVITHGDDDHMGSLSVLDGVVQVDRVLVAADAFDCECSNCEELIEEATALVGEENVIGLKVGDVIEVGLIELEVIWPESFQDEGGNADSLCLLALADVDSDGEVDCTALFVGDVEADQLEVLVESGAVGEVDIYKVGHHGSKNALTEELALTLSPAIALVSCGENNSYGHPAEVTIEALEAAGATIFCSDEVGDVTCRITAEKIVVSTQGG